MSWATATQTSEPTSPRLSAASGPSQAADDTARRPVPIQATTGRRRTMTTVMSAPIPPMTHVTNGCDRPASFTAAKAAFGTTAAATSARPTAHREGASRVSVSASSGAATRRRVGRRIQSQAIGRYRTSAAISSQPRSTVSGSVHRRLRAER